MVCLKTALKIRFKDQTYKCNLFGVTDPDGYKSLLARGFSELPAEGEADFEIVIKNGDWDIVNASNEFEHHMLKFNQAWLYWKELYLEILDIHNRITLGTDPKYTVLARADGSVLVVNNSDNSVIDGQRSWLSLLMNHMRECGYEIRNCSFIVPSGDKYVPDIKENSEGVLISGILDKSSSKRNFELVIAIPNTEKIGSYNYQKIICTEGSDGNLYSDNYIVDRNYETARSKESYQDYKVVSTVEL